MHVGEWDGGMVGNQRERRHGVDERNHRPQRQIPRPHSNLPLLAHPVGAVNTGTSHPLRAGGLRHLRVEAEVDAVGRIGSDLTLSPAGSAVPTRPV